MTKVPITRSTRTQSRAGERGSIRRKSTQSHSTSIRRSKKIKFKLPKLPQWHWNGISSERKLDILGLILTLIGSFTLIGLFFPTSSGLVDYWVKALSHLVGWGIFILPLALIIFGLWLIFRRVDRLPSLTLERSVGLIFIYLNLLTWMHLIPAGGWTLAEDGQGGGYIGSFIKILLVSAIGILGTATFLVAWLLIALSISLDLSIFDMFNRLFSFFRSLVDPLFQAWSESLSPLIGNTKSHQSTIETSTADLPPDFQPITPGLEKEHRHKPARSDARKPIGPITQKQTVDPSNAAALESIPNDFPDISITVTPKTAVSAWVLPTVSAILDPPTPVAIQSNLDQQRSRIIEETLTSFGAPGHIVEIHRGPTITQYGVEPDFVEGRTGKTRVRVSRIASLTDDLALALAASRIRIQAPVPGRSYVGIEVPNTEISLVSLREVLESDSFQKHSSILRFGLGKDVAGKSLTGDLRAMPHMLIAGTTGSGKSVCINSILCSFLLFNTPADLRLVLIDPKRVELTGFNGIPHLLAPVVVDPERVIGALQWMMREMDSRYHKFTKVKVRNINEYNQGQQNEYIPHIVIVIDELADLMMLAREETERCISRLAQLARATGIHLILATQRPSVDVITGLIKANFPARIAFAVASGIDSRVILDQPGAERLLGRGDMLFQAPDAPSPIRLQSPYVSDSEIQLLVDYWRFNALPPDQPKPVSTVNGAIEPLPYGVPLQQIPLWKEENGDPLLDEAIELSRREGRASITMLQRRLRVGYTRAARMIDTMEEKGIIGPSRADSQVREILDYGPAAPPAEGD